MLLIKVTMIQYTIATNITFVQNFHNLRTLNYAVNAARQIHTMPDIAGIVAKT